MSYPALTKCIHGCNYHQDGCPDEQIARLASFSPSCATSSRRHWARPSGHCNRRSRHAVPFITRGVIDSVVRALQSAKMGSYRSLLLAGVAIFVLTAATRALRSVYNYRLFRLASNAEDDAKNAAFSNFLHLDAEYHGAVNTGEVIGALDRGATAVFVVLYEIFGQNLVPPTLIVLGVMATLLMSNPLIA
jgi:ABC-type multidrug transport system fused ATPase/permease subunit